MILTTHQSGPGVDIDAQMDLLEAIKHHFDPNTIMNPDGQLGLDLNGSHWREMG